MSLDWSCGELAAGLQCYRNQEFFLAHEHWEIVWLKCQEPEKTFLQALIQVTAAFHHLGRRNLVGAASLLRASLRRLEAYPPLFGGLDVASLRHELQVWLSALDVQQRAPDLSFPELRDQDGRPLGTRA